MQFRNMSQKRYFKNDTIAMFDEKNKFMFYYKAPVSLAIDYPITYYPDRSYLIDFNETN